MSFTEKLQREQLESLKGQFNYASDCLANRQNEMASFEVKEYTKVAADLANEILELENHINLVF